MAELIEVASGLRFPEGPIAMPDGSVILVEMFGPRITRVLPDGSKETVAEVPGGPNGLAIGPDGALYVCNNGARFTAIDIDGITLPGPTTPENYIGGRIQRVDIATGEVNDLYTECDGRPLMSPNDIVFDEHGGFYVTDHSMTRRSDDAPHRRSVRQGGRVVAAGGRVPRTRAERRRAVARWSHACTTPRRGPGE